MNLKQFDIFMKDQSEKVISKIQYSDNNSINCTKYIFNGWSIKIYLIGKKITKIFSTLQETELSYFDPNLREHESFNELMERLNNEKPIQLMQFFMFS